MAISDILDGVFKLLKANFRTIAVIVGTLVIPFQIVAAVVQRSTLGGRSILQIVHDPSTQSTNNGNLTSSIVSLVIALVNLLLLPFVGGAIAKVVAASYLGQQLPPGEALRAMGRRALSLVAAWWTWHPIEFLGLALCIFPGLAWMTMFVMVAPAIVTEDLSFFKGLRRSWSLASRRFWPTLGTALVTGLMATVLASILSGLPQLIGLLIGLKWGFLLVAAGAALNSLIVLPIAAITATLLYFDARIRTEGFDLEILAAGLARAPA